eukprot:gene11298-4109_t
MNKDKVKNAYEKHPKVKNHHFKYGTAGFRMKSEIMDSVVFITGVLAALRSMETKQITGIVITASHNEVEDNGVKVIDSNGEYMEKIWEKRAEELANCNSTEEFLGLIGNFFKDTQPVVYVAADTRPSSPDLLKSTIEGIECVGGKVFDFGLLTTPVLHFMVKHDNDQKSNSKDCSPYYELLSTSFKKLIGDKKTEKRNIDCAFGVGAVVLKELQKYLPNRFELLNDDISRTENLNKNCGAEHVQKEKKKPLNFKNCVASFDGDGDRIVYSYEKDQFILIDGDKISSLITLFFSKYLPKDSGLSVGVVQTAYANGASTKFLKSYIDNCPIVPTGVKHLHHKSKEFDIGIYFEANGHGTVVFSSKALKYFQENSETLLQFSNMVNQTVGDAVSDLLMVEVILSLLDMSIEDWIKLYTDLPSVQSKLKVKDRTVIQTSVDETQVIKPDGVQEKLNDLMKKYNNSRTFIRPSGTEDVVRIYAEAETEQDSKNLAFDVSLIIFDHLGGIGERPQ